jgi:hypothetical protein
MSHSSARAACPSRATSVSINVLRLAIASMPPIYA